MLLLLCFGMVLSQDISVEPLEPEEITTTTQKVITTTEEVATTTEEDLTTTETESEEVTEPEVTVTESPVDTRQFCFYYKSIYKFYPIKLFS